MKTLTLSAANGTYLDTDVTVEGTNTSLTHKVYVAFTQITSGKIAIQYKLKNKPWSPLGNVDLSTTEVAEFEFSGDVDEYRFVISNASGTGTIQITDSETEQDIHPLSFYGETGGMTPEEIGLAIKNAETIDSDKSANTFADLRLFTGLINGEKIYLKGHTTTGVGGGVFLVDTASTDADDNGVTAVTGEGVRIVRVLDGYVTLEMFGLVGSGDESVEAQAGLSYMESIGGGRIGFSTDFEFSALTIPALVHLSGVGNKSSTIISNLVSGDAVTVTGSGDSALWNGISNLTIDATAARQAGTGRGLVIDSGDTNKVAFKCKADVVVRNQPGDSFEAVQPEHCDIDVTTIDGGGRGCVVSAPNNTGIANKIRLRSINCAGKPIDIKTYASDINAVEALVEGTATPAYTGVLMTVDGDGNTITSTDSELNGNPPDADILLCTGIELLGDGNTMIGGYAGNCGKSIDIGGRGNKVVNPKLSIYSTAASATVVGSKGIFIRAGAAGARVEYDTYGTTKIETSIEDLAPDTILTTDGKVNGISKTLNYAGVWDPASMPDSGVQTTTVAIAGSTLGSPVVVGHTGITSGIGGNNKVEISGFSVNGSVIVTVHNMTGAALDIPSGTLSVKVFL